VQIIYHKKPKPTNIEPRVAQPKKYKEASILPLEFEDKFNILYVKIIMTSYIK
jgi:hypothetical protein